MQVNDLTQCSAQALLEGISELLGSEREITAKLLAHLGEVEERRLHLEMGHSSLFDFCVARYKMSEGQAFRRVLGARLARRFPVIHSLIASGRLHLSALQMLGERLTPENHVELLESACHKSKRELEVWLAARFPKPDVPAQIRKLPAPRTQSRGPAEGLLPGVDAVAVRRPNERGRLEPLSESRFKVEFTASAALREKLERARDLMSHANPSREIAPVLESALDLLLEKLESRRLGKLKRSRRKLISRAGKQSAARVSREVRRQVFARDGERCTFVGPDGFRCSARSFLELDHIDPLGLGALAMSPISASDVARTISSGRSRRSGASTSPPAATFAGESPRLGRPVDSGMKGPATRSAAITREPRCSSPAKLWRKYASRSKNSGFETPKPDAQWRSSNVQPVATTQRPASNNCYAKRCAGCRSASRANAERRKRRDSRRASRARSTESLFRGPYGRKPGSEALCTGSAIR